MKKYTCLGLVFLFSFILIQSNFAQDNFEGIVNVKILHNDEDSNLKYYTKEGAFKIEMTGGKELTKGDMILKDNKMLVLMPSEKMYMEMPIDMSKKTEKYDKEIDENLTKTGNEKEILGYKTEEWILKGEDYQVEIWSTNELGNFMAFSGFQADQNTPEWQKKLLEEGFFPLLAVQKNKSGKEIYRMEVTDIEKKKLESSIFEPPKDFTKMEMPMNLPKKNKNN